MKVREHLTYANVVATLALVGVIGGGGAYAASKIGSSGIENNSIRSADLKNGEAVRGKDVLRDSLGGGDIDEADLRASQFAPLAGEQGDCDPTAVDFVPCAEVSIDLGSASRLLVIATGDFFAEAPAARLTCRIAVDGVNTQAGASPGNDPTDNTSLGATDGFSSTLVTQRLDKGIHDVALRCSQPTAADGRLGSASVAALGLSH